VLAVITWDQTLLSLLLAAALAFLAYGRAARVLRLQEQRRRLQEQRDALQHVLLGLEGPVAAYLAAEAEEEYPQREMVELERRALQAQIHWLGDLGLQKALRDICYPQRHSEAVASIRSALERLERDIAALG